MSVYQYFKQLRELVPRLEKMSNLCALYLTLKNEHWMKNISESIECIKKTGMFFQLSLLYLFSREFKQSIKLTSM